MPCRPSAPVVTSIGLATTVLVFAVLALTPSWAVSQEPHPAVPQSAVIQIYASAEDNALPIGTMAAGENATPIAETQGAGGVRWYLVKTSNGIVGWIKPTDGEPAKKVVSFFKSLPPEASAITLPSISSATAPHGSVIVPVLSSIGGSTIVAVTLNQSIRANLMLDTGATNTMVSRRLSRALSLRPAGNAAVHTVGGVIAVAIAPLQSLKVGEAEVTDLLVIIHDFSPDPRIEGLLGMDFLGRYKIGLDTRRQVLVLSPR